VSICERTKVMMEVSHPDSWRRHEYDVIPERKGKKAQGAQCRYTAGVTYIKERYVGVPWDTRRRGWVPVKVNKRLGKLPQEHLTN